MIRRREKKNIYEFSLIISLESLINQSVWGCGRVISVTDEGRLKTINDCFERKILVLAVDILSSFFLQRIPETKCSE